MTGYVLGENEVVKLGFLLVIAGDAHDISAVLRCQVGVFITRAWRIRSAWSMFSQKTIVRSNRLVSLEKLRDLLRHQPGRCSRTRVLSKSFWL